MTNEEVIEVKKRRGPKAKTPEEIAEAKERKKLKNREYQKKYRAENKEKINECRRLYRESHREELREQYRNYYEEHKDKLKAYAKQYYDAHRETILEKTRIRRSESDAPAYVCDICFSILTTEKKLAKHKEASSRCKRIARSKELQRLALNEE